MEQVEGLQRERQGLLEALEELAARQVAGQDRELLAAGAAGLPPQVGLRRGVVSNQQLVGDAVVNSLQPVGDAVANSLRPVGDVELNSLQPDGDAALNSLRLVEDAVAKPLPEVAHGVEVVRQAKPRHVVPVAVSRPGRPGNNLLLAVRRAVQFRQPLPTGPETDKWWLMVIGITCRRANRPIASRLLIQSAIACKRRLETLALDGTGVF